jgi:hypothetical protein
MAKETGRWTLEDVVDFEHEIGISPHAPAGLRAEVVAAARGLDGSAARRAGFAVWLDGVRKDRAGGRFVAALSMVGAGFAVLMFLAGISGVLGMLDRSRAGVNVSLFLAILIGGQWLLLLLGLVAWLARGRARGGLGVVQGLVGRLARKFAGSGESPWWGRLAHEGGPGREVLLWRTAHTVQAGGVAFNLGILVGLAGLVLLRHVGFFWETTTDAAMAGILETNTRFLGAPWSAWTRGFVPDAEVIARSRWTPGSTLGPGPAEWWRFLLMTTLVWGLLPRVLLWLAAWRAERRALARLDFQSRPHRILWRELTGSDRAEADDKPLDGVLVLDVGGSGLTEESLRPFLLRRLRVHPAAWLPVAVMDAGAEAEAARALKNAPAGVVLLSEGWALSPPRMTALHAKVRAQSGPETPIRFLVANSISQIPSPPTLEERQEWERFVDSLRDAEADVCFYEELQPV